MVAECEQSTKLTFPNKNLNQNVLNMETIKVFNSVYESQGGRFLDVVHQIYTDQTLEEVLEQTRELETHFKETYKGLRNICVKAMLPPEKVGA